MIRNYFADLELDSTASLDDIKRAYRRLVRRFHPDLNPFDSHAADSFQRIQEAYDYLSSGTRITRLKKELAGEKSRGSDAFGKWGLVPTLTGKSGERISEWKEEKTKSKKLQSRPPEDLGLRVEIKISDAFWKRGGQNEIRYLYDQPCPQCRGKGARSKAVTATCKSCAGRGAQLIQRGAMQWSKACDACQGRGYRVGNACSVCGGRGKVAVYQTLKFNLQKNIELSKPFCIKEMGHISFDGKKRGDLWLTIATKR